MTELHLILGAGQIGSLVADALRHSGKRVRVGRRTPSSTPGIETVSLDVCDPDAVAKAADGAEVVYHCANPAYRKWPELLLPMTRGIVDGTARAGARLVVLDNLYVYGDTSHLREGQPMSPVSKKGELRKRATELVLERDARGDLFVAIARAADFYGPNAPQAVYGNRVFECAFAGRTLDVLGDLDQVHSYAYVHDVARGLVVLGSRKTRGEWMLPAPSAETTRQLLDRFSAAIGRPIRTRHVANWMLRAIGLFAPQMREVVEMTYQWKQPYVVDDAKFRAAFGFGATPWAEAIAQTARWASATYSVQRAG
jgi:nucleoside-diphosphate-sugar epimerase